MGRVRWKGAPPHGGAQSQQKPKEHETWTDARSRSRGRQHKTIEPEKLRSPGAVVIWGHAVFKPIMFTTSKPLVKSAAGPELPWRPALMSIVWPDVVIPSHGWPPLIECFVSAQEILLAPEKSALLSWRRRRLVAAEAPTTVRASKITVSLPDMV